MFFYGKEIKTSLVRATALGQSCIILSESMRSLRGVPAGRLVGISVFILSVAPVRLQCVLKPQALICSQY